MKVFPIIKKVIKVQPSGEAQGGWIDKLGTQRFIVQESNGALADDSSVSFMSPETIPPQTDFMTLVYRDFEVNGVLDELHRLITTMQEANAALVDDAGQRFTIVSPETIGAQTQSDLLVATFAEPLAGQQDDHKLILTPTGEVIPAQTDAYSLLITIILLETNATPTEAHKLAATLQETLATQTEAHQLRTIFQESNADFTQLDKLTATLLETIAAQTESHQLKATIQEANATPSPVNNITFDSAWTWNTAAVVDIAHEAGSGGNNKQWINPNNAKVNDAATASISAAATAIATDDFSSALALSSLITTTIPAGATRTKVEVYLEHGWDLTVAVLDTAHYYGRLESSDGVTNYQTLFNLTQANGTRASAIDIYDVTAAVSALTDAQLATLRVRLYAVANLGAVTAANASINVDFCLLYIRHTVNGLAG